MVRWTRAWLLAVAVAGCGGTDRPEPDRDRLRHPTGLALGPAGRWLFVTGGNWDLAQTHGTLMAVDLDAVHAALADPDDARCGTRDGDVRVCDDAAFIDARRTVLMGSALGNIAVDLPGGAAGTARVLIPQRNPAAIVWVDAFFAEDGVRFDCGQTAENVCGNDHAIDEVEDDPGRSLPRDPSRVVLDREGFRFAYVPHLLDSAISLIALDGARGPELTSVETDFYTEDPFDDDDSLAGGFSVAQRACDPADPPRASRDCTRPVLFTTHRYWPGMRSFTVAPGLEVVLPGSNALLEPLNPEVVESRPFMGDLEFEDPQTGELLLVVQTTPGGLARVDTSLDDEGQTRDQTLSAVSVCQNPNLLEVYRPEGEEPLALVTCFGAGALTVVSLASFRVVRTIELGQGANEIALDEGRRQAYVANTVDGTISIVSLDRTDARFLTAWARIGA